MEILLLGVYAAFVWLLFIKLKWLPWNIYSQVTVVVIPIVAPRLPVVSEASVSVNVPVLIVPVPVSPPVPPRIRAEPPGITLLAPRLSVPPP